MITLEEFEEVFKIVKEFEDDQDKLTQILLKDINGFVDFGFPIADLVLRLLNKVFGLDDPDLFSWWLYEDVKKVIYMPDGIEYDLTDIKDLYFYVKGEYDKVKKNLKNSSSQQNSL